MGAGTFVEDAKNIIGLEDKITVVPAVVVVEGLIEHKGLFGGRCLGSRGRGGSGSGLGESAWK